MALNDQDGLLNQRQRPLTSQQLDDLRRADAIYSQLKQQGGDWGAHMVGGGDPGLSYLAQQLARTGASSLADLTFKDGQVVNTATGKSAYLQDANFSQNDAGGTYNTVATPSLDAQGRLTFSPTVSYTPYKDNNFIGDVLKVAAPIALSAFGAPYLATAFGGGLGATIGAGAITGAAGSAITGGNILKGAALGGIGSGIGYGINSSGLLSGLDNAAPVEYDPSVFSDLPDDFYGVDPVPVSETIKNWPSAPPAPVYPTAPNSSPFKDIQGFNNDAFGGTPKPTSIGGDLPTTPDAFGPGFGNLAPGNGITTLGGPVAPPEPSIEGMIEQAKAAGKSVADWAKANPLYARAAMMAGGALLNTVGGTSNSGGSGYKDDGYRPTISRGGFQASIPAPGMPSGGPGMAPGGLASGVTLPSTGQANDGLWRFSGNRPSGLLPGLASAMPRPPQTGLINPPAVANYDPAGGMREMVPTNSPQPGYGYDDPVVNKNPPMSPDMQRALTQFGLLDTNPAPRGWM